MFQKPKKKFGIYHWDTFDNNTILIGEENTFEKAKKFVENKYKERIRSTGADRVDIIEFPEGIIMERYNIG